MADTVIWSDMEGGNQASPAGGLIVEFFRDSKRNVHKSLTEGFPLDEGIDRVKVWQVGEKDNVIFDVDLSHQRRWPQQWAAYKEGREQLADGMPLDLLFPGSPEVVSTLRANHIYTIEQLANFPESTTFPFALTHKQKARTFLDHRKGDAMPAMEAKMAELLEEVARLKAQPPAAPRRGRPPKITQPQEISP